MQVKKLEIENSQLQISRRCSPPEEEISRIKITYNFELIEIKSVSWLISLHLLFAFWATEQLALLALPFYADRFHELQDKYRC